MSSGRTRRRIQLTVSIILAVLVTAGLAVLAVMWKESRLPMIYPYDEQNIGYVDTAQTVIYADAAFAQDLCIGPNEVGTDRVDIEKGAHAGLFSVEEREVVYAKGMHEQIYPASVTKLMTAIVVLKNGNLNDIVTVAWQDLELEEGSQVVGLRIGDKISVEALMYGLLVHSGNDAAMALARHVGGTMENFVEMMNEEAQKIGATQTHFVNPSGLHDNDHYTTVYDIYLMLREAIRYDFFVNAMQITVYDLMYHNENGDEKHVTLDSTDLYLTGQQKPPKDVTVLGGKTGTTIEAGSCLAIVAQNAFGQPYIAVVMGEVNKDCLYKDMNALLGIINA